MDDELKKLNASIKLLINTINEIFNAHNFHRVIFGSFRSREPG